MLRQADWPDSIRVRHDQGLEQDAGGSQMTPQEIIKAILAALTAGVDVSLQFDGITIGEIEVKALVVTVRAGKGNDAQQGGK
jgi:hypothetical protein